nr:RibD C-terminal domain protein [uncultured bacterium]
MKVFSNLAVSIDGKIATVDRSYFPLGTPEDRRQMQVLRREADAIVNGASTLRTFKKPMSVKGAKKQPINAVVSSTLEGFSPAWPFFKDASVPRVLFVSPRASAKRLKLFEKSSEIEVLKPRAPTALQVIRALEKRGVRSLLVEGGGGIMWDFVSEDLIDEYHVTVTPRLVGGKDAPTLVDGLGLKPRDVVNVRLVQSRVVGDELYLIYAKTGKRG